MASYSRKSSRTYKLDGGINSVDSVVSLSSAGPRGCIHVVFKLNSKEGSTVDYVDVWLTESELKQLRFQIDNVLDTIRYERMTISEREEHDPSY